MPIEEKIKIRKISRAKAAHLSLHPLKRNQKKNTLGPLGSHTEGTPTPQTHKTNGKPNHCL